MKNEKPVRVVFRAWRSKACPAPFALFPDTPANPGCDASCYAPHEGHGGADYTSCMRQTRPATPEEAAPVRAQLVEHYGYNLREVRRR